MRFSRRGSFHTDTVARMVVATIIVGLVFAVFAGVRYRQERDARISQNSEQIARLDEQQKEILAQQKLLDEQQAALRQFKIQACHDLNVQIKHLIATEYLKDVHLMDRLLPPPRSGVRALIAATFISTGVAATKLANPYHDCSAKALGLLPIAQPGSSSPSSSPATTTTSRAPPGKPGQAGTTASRSPPIPPTTRPGRRRRPPHP